jgi:hypothetical protein
MPLVTGTFTRPRHRESARVLMKELCFRLVDRSRIIPTAFDYTGHDTDQVSCYLIVGRVNIC